MKQLIHDRENNPLNGVIIQGSARSDGNTSLVTQYFSEQSQMHLVDLNDWKIEPFSYEPRTTPDDFLPLIEKLLTYDVWIIATPVYWYAMSSVLKVFFDRFTDLLKWHKDTGRQLRGKSIGLLSCSGDNDLDSFFSLPLQRSADYLGMAYIGEAHAWVRSGAIHPEAIEKMNAFAQVLEQWVVARVTD